ncbi:MAG TPA: periplasmic heavy metal sensor [Pyrinomonadaceae bacterium]|nr:periplasmic heavy metal sensor [Pyrinomonadaceae bacterium]
MKERINNFSSRKLALFASLALLLAAGSVAPVRAQDGDAPELTPEARRGGGGAGLLRALNLTPEQRAQIKAIRRETEPQGRLLGMRLQQARRALDEAIYADNPDERVVEERVREVSAAQAAVVRMRTFTELKIRRVLSPEQLDAFRRLQRRPRRRQQRMNQNPPQDDFPGGVNATPAPPGNARQRRRTPLLREARPLRP